MSLHHNSEKGAPLGYILRERGETLTRSVYGGGVYTPAQKLKGKITKLQSTLKACIYLLLLYYPVEQKDDLKLATSAF